MSRAQGSARATFRCTILRMRGAQELPSGVDAKKVLYAGKDKKQRNRQANSPAQRLDHAIVFVVTFEEVIQCREQAEGNQGHHQKYKVAVHRHYIILDSVPKYTLAGNQRHTLCQRL